METEMEAKVRVRLGDVRDQLRDLFEDVRVDIREVVDECELQGKQIDLLNEIIQTCKTDLLTISGLIQHAQDGCGPGGWPTMTHWRAILNWVVEKRKEGKLSEDT